MAEYSPFSMSPDGQADDNPFRTVAKDMLPFGDMPIKAAPMDQSLMQRLYSGVQNQVTPGSSVDKLFGFHGDRYQFWPEKTLRSGAGAPMAAMTGEYGQPGTREFSENAVGPANDMTALMGTGMFRNTPSVGTFGGRLPSAVTRAIEEAPLKTGTPDQWAGYIRNRPGVGQEELQYGGVQKYLQNQPKGQVSQQALADFAKANQVELRDVTKGPPDYDLSDKLAGDRQNIRYQLDVARRTGNRQEMARLADLDDALTKQIVESAGTPPKFEKYQTPGGENYREMLLTMPQKESGFDPAKVEIKRNLRSQTQGETAIWYDGKRIISYGDDPSLMPGGQYQQRPDSHWMDVARNLYERGDRINKVPPQAGNFTSSHWEEPNVLAHVRMNDRNINGKKTLFLEEIQSDWHQKGRESGYKGQAENPEAVKARQEIAAAAEANDAANRALYAKFNELNPNARAIDVHAATSTLINDPRATRSQIETVISRHGPGWRDIVLTDELNALAANVRNHGTNLGELQARHGPILRDQSSTVPDAPFKKSWHDLALKRMLVEAVEKGYDQIAWTTGDMQNARYPSELRRAATSINWETPKVTKEVINIRPVDDEIRRLSNWPQNPGIARNPADQPRLNELADIWNRWAARDNPNIADNYGGHRVVRVTPKDGGEDLIFGIDKDGVIRQAKHGEAEGKSLQELVGNEMARSIMGQKQGKIEGKDFIIGGKGMQDFYDKMLPVAANKIGKVHGARVERGYVGGEKRPTDYGDFIEWEAAHRDGKTATSNPVHILHITPSLRKAIQNKQINLFNRGGRIHYSNGGRVSHGAVAQLDRILAREQAFYASP